MTNPTPQPDVVPDEPDVGRPTGRHTRPARPGWVEVGVAAVVYGALYLLAWIVQHTIPDRYAVASGLASYTLSALLGLGAFAAAWAVRIRNLRAFGVRRVRWTWLLAGAALGLVAVVTSNLLGFAYQTLTGDVATGQDGYQAAATGGPAFLVATLVLGAVATPVGEELAFRGVLTNALGRYGAWVAVPGSAIVFAAAHGFNVIALVALVNGVVAALLFRRTGSIWPGVCLHLTNNAYATLYPVLVAAAS